MKASFKITKGLFKRRFKNPRAAQGCRYRPSPRDLTLVDKVCEDCYNLYKTSDVYEECRWISFQEERGPHH